MHIALWAYICRYSLTPGSDHWSVASREDEEGTQRLLSSGGRWRCSAVTRSLHPRDVGTWVSWTWGRSVGWDLVEKRRGATTSGGQVADPSTQGVVGSHQVPASQWPLVLWLLLLPGVQGDGRRIWVWVLKFLGERLCSGSCLNVPQAGSRPASSLWYKGHLLWGSASFSPSEWRWWGRWGRRCLCLKNWKTSDCSLWSSQKDAVSVVNGNLALHAW